MPLIAPTSELESNQLQPLSQILIRRHQLVDLRVSLGESGEVRRLRFNKCGSMGALAFDERGFPRLQLPAEPLVLGE